MVCAITSIIMVSTTIGVYLNGQLVRGGRGASSPKGRAHGLDLDRPGHSISFVDRIPGSRAQIFVSQLRQWCPHCGSHVCPGRPGIKRLVWGGGGSPPVGRGLGGGGSSSEAPPPKVLFELRTPGSRISILFTRGAARGKTNSVRVERSLPPSIKRWFLFGVGRQPPSKTGAGGASAPQKPFPPTGSFSNYEPKDPGFPLT